MSYREEVPRTEGLDRFSGVHITNPGLPTQTHGLGGEKGKTLFRPFPEFSNGVEMPYRLSAEPFHFSSFMKAEKFISMAGVKDKFTCFVRVKDKDRNFQGPIEKFIWSLKKSLKDVAEGKMANPGFPQEWFTWNAKQGALPRIEVRGLMQGMLFENAGKAYKDEMGKSKPLNPVLLVMTKSAREEVEKLCNAEVPGYDGPPDDYNHRFKSGDLVSCAGGKLLSFVFVPPSGKEFARYDLAVGQSCKINAEAAARNWMPWDKLLKFLTEEEQMNLLLSHFPPEAVDFVLGHGEKADLLPHGVRGKWASRNSVQNVHQHAQPQFVQQFQPAQTPQPQYQQATVPPMMYNPPPTQIVSGGYTPNNTNTAAATSVAPWEAKPVAAPTMGEDEFSFGGEDFEVVPSKPTQYVSPAVSAEIPQAHPVRPSTSGDPTGAESRAVSAKQALLNARAAMQAKMGS